MALLPVRLRPFTEPDLDLFDRFASDPSLSEPFEWVGYRPTLRSRQRWQDDRLLGSSPYYLAVATVENDALVGWVDWRENERLGQDAWEIGVLIVPEMRGRGAGSACQRLLVDYLFSNTTAHRIWATTELDNVAEQRALDRCGFKQEGLLRGTHFRAGRWRDSYIYGLVREDLDSPQ